MKTRRREPAGSAVETGLTVCQTRCVQRLKTRCRTWRMGPLTKTVFLVWNAKIYKSHGQHLLGALN